MEAHGPLARLREPRSLLTLILLGAVAWSVASVDWAGGVAQPNGLAAVGEFFAALADIDVSGAYLAVAANAAWVTVAYAVAGITLALAIGVPLGVVASGVLLGAGADRLALSGVARLVLAALRSVHELIWAWFFVVAVGLSPMAAVLALALPYGGILGRNFAEMLNDVPEEPLRALRANGASPAQVFLYGRLPMALPAMLGYAFYRFECAIRAAAIFSFVGIAGIGFQIQLSLDDLVYGQVWTMLLVLLALVVAVDVWSNALRRGLLSRGW